MDNTVIATIVFFLASTVRQATPLLLAATGGLYSERSGVINIALEGLMLAGAFTAAAVTHYTGSIWTGLLAGMLAGVAVSAIHAVACIQFKADQVVSGTDINILMLGVPALVSGTSTTKARKMGVPGIKFSFGTCGVEPEERKKAPLTRAGMPVIRMLMAVPLTT